MRALLLAEIVMEMWSNSDKELKKNSRPLSILAVIQMCIAKVEIYYLAHKVPFGCS